MSLPMQRPRRKNPLLRTRAPTLPPWGRSRVALGLTAAAAVGRFELQQCADCGAVQYPPREACHVCLSARLQWKPQSGAGMLLSETTLHHSNDLFFRERLPWRLGLVRLDCGPTLMVHLPDCTPAAPAAVRVDARLDRAGQAVLLGLPIKEIEHMNDDRVLRAMHCDPKFRKVLVTDGKTALGQALVKSLAAAGADLIWVGHAEPWKKLPGFDDLSALPQVTVVPLDLSSAKSVAELAGEVAGKVDIVINNAEVHRTHGIATRRGVDAARA